MKEGDYVNGNKVILIYKDGITILGLETECNLHILLNDDIKSIVTKEQFENMSYKVSD